MVANLKPGSLLGRFRIKKLVGGNQTGVLYRAEDTLLEVPVGLKVFSPDLAADEMYKLISREILITRRLNHPGICTIHDLHEEKGRRFITMDWVEGITLDKLLARHKKRGLPVRDGVRIVGLAGEAVAAAHAAGIAHRDLKPANLVVNQEGRVTILEFGHARAPDMGGNTVPVVRNEDIAYTAQEILFDKPATAASDVYSLGAILYRCVTGRNPLEASGKPKMNTGFRGFKPVPPSRLNKQIPQSLEQVILTAISANPESRYRDAGEFTAELLDTMEDLSVRARRPRRAAADTAPPPPVDADGSGGGEGQDLAAAMERSTLLFSDIVGITSFFEAHGDIAGRKRIERHNELLFPVIRRHNGSVLKTIGDAIMASFQDEDEAVEAAIRMQQVLEHHNQAARRETDRIFIRIGINTGETIVEYGDAYGDAVNVAARVCSKADGEQILISEETCRELDRNRDIINPHSIVELKGKRDQFQLFQVDWLLAEDIQETVEEPPDLSTDKDEEPTAEGEATEVFQAFSEPATPAAPAPVIPSAASPLDRLFASFGLVRDTKTVVIVVAVLLILLMLVVALFASMCSGPTEVVVDDPLAGHGVDYKPR